MIEFLRSLFGISDASGNRAVVGGNVSVDARDVQYIKDSNLRIAALHQLYTRYKGTPHEAKLKEVYHKTKDIHVYLVYKKRVHALELFHLQNTDHFINTFTVILDVHQKHAAPVTTPSARDADSFFRNLRSTTSALATKTKAVPEAVSTTAASQRQLLQAQGADVPAATLPDVSIDTSSRVLYVREDAAQGAVTKEICFTSPQAEKEAFLAHVAARLGVYKGDVSYSGNALLAVPSAHGPNAAAYVPIIHWKGLTYALSLTDYRLFPVRVYRRNF